MEDLEMLEIDCALDENCCFQIDPYGTVKNKITFEICELDLHTTVVMDKQKVKKVIDYLDKLYKVMK